MVAGPVADVRLDLDLDAGLDADIDPDRGDGGERFAATLARELARPADADHGPMPDRRARMAREEGAERSAAAEFWELYDRSAAEAELSAAPPAAVTAVIGPLAAATPVARRCRDQRSMGRCDVLVLTQAPSVPGEPDWEVVTAPSMLVSALEDADRDLRLLVLDVPDNLPRVARPLMARLRASGVGLVHYVLEGDPDDEDLATWHGELGRPSALNLASPLAPSRILELVDRGEPVVSVAGLPLSAELLLALRVS